MPYKLVVYVKPHESAEELNESVKDPNVDLVYRGLPSFPVRLGYNTEYQKNVKPVEVQSVVVFEMVGEKLEAAQRVFLDHLRREGIVLSYAWFNEVNGLMGQSE